MSKSALNTTEQNIQITDDPVNRFYEITVDGTYAGLLVRADWPAVRADPHLYRTVFPRPGLATRLIRHVMDDLRTKGTTATNYCPVIDAFLHKTPSTAVSSTPGPEADPQRHRPGNRPRCRQTSTTAADVASRPARAVSSRMLTSCMAGDPGVRGRR